MLHNSSHNIHQTMTYPANAEEDKKAFDSAIQELFDAEPGKKKDAMDKAKKALQKGIQDINPLLQGEPAVKQFTNNILHTLLYTYEMEYFKNIKSEATSEEIATYKKEYNELFFDILSDKQPQVPSDYAKKLQQFDKIKKSDGQNHFSSLHSANNEQASALALEMIPNLARDNFDAKLDLSRCMEGLNHENIIIPIADENEYIQYMIAMDPLIGALLANNTVQLQMIELSFLDRIRLSARIISGMIIDIGQLMIVPTVIVLAFPLTELLAPTFAMGISSVVATPILMPVMALIALVYFVNQLYSELENTTLKSAINHSAIDQNIASTAKSMLIGQTDDQMKKQQNAPKKSYNDRRVSMMTMLTGFVDFNEIIKIIKEFTKQLWISKQCKYKKALLECKQKQLNKKQSKQQLQLRQPSKNASNSIAVPNNNTNSNNSVAQSSQLTLNNNKSNSIAVPNNNTNSNNSIVQPSQSIPNNNNPSNPVIQQNDKIITKTRIDNFTATLSNLSTATAHSIKLTRTSRANIDQMISTLKSKNIKQHSMTQLC